jgi:hypothetical protein
VALRQALHGIVKAGYVSDMAAYDRTVFVPTRRVSSRLPVPLTG